MTLQRDRIITNHLTQKLGYKKQKMPRSPCGWEAESLEHTAVAHIKNCFWAGSMGTAGIGEPGYSFQPRERGALGRQ